MTTKVRSLAQTLTVKAVQAEIKTRGYEFRTMDEGDCVELIAPNARLAIAVNENGTCEVLSRQKTLIGSYCYDVMRTPVEGSFTHCVKRMIEIHEYFNPVEF